MSKDALINELLALPTVDQEEILHLLHDRLHEAGVLSEEQERDLDRRLDCFNREGSRGEPWEQVRSSLS